MFYIDQKWTKFHLWISLNHKYKTTIHTFGSLIWVSSFIPGTTLNVMAPCEMAWTMKKDDVGSGDGNRNSLLKHWATQTLKISLNGL